MGPLSSGLASEDGYADRRGTVMAKELYYTTNVSWTGKKKAIVSFENNNKPDIGIAVAPEFMGHNDIVTPEDLFVSSVNACMMSYFINVAERMRIRFNSYESSARGTLTEDGIDFVFTRIDIDLKVVVDDEKNVEKAKRAIEMAKKGCFVANSIKADVAVSYDVSMEGK
ncbi:MAG TPA: OsmC family protein [Candidatus Methanofastidiosa archaeon]|nr:OsmC family protein [Candidatus Methanofastidiosa archaeon]HPR42541.1 OsmC family protein [Candidatus Methanofastidiosa archaeon]